MHVLVVFAHPERDSLSGNSLNKFIAGLEAAGHTYDLMDLYHDEFDPTFNTADLAYYRDQGPMPQEISDIHKRIDEANAMAFIFPLWWWSVPAILKGWFDRVLTSPFAFTYDENGLQGALSDKKIVMLCTGSNDRKGFQKYGYDAAMQRQIEAGVWFYCGLDDVETHLTAGIDESEDARMAHLALSERVGRTIADD